MKLKNDESLKKKGFEVVVLAREKEENIPWYQSESQLDFSFLGVFVWLFNVLG